MNTLQRRVELIATFTNDPDLKLELTLRRRMTFSKKFMRAMERADGVRYHYRRGQPPIIRSVLLGTVITTKKQNGANAFSKNASK
jgi:hypothetical protein